MPPVTGAPLPYVVQVVSPQAHCAAISDSLGLIAIANRAITGKGGEVSIFGLDARGQDCGHAHASCATAAQARQQAAHPAATPALPLPPKPLYTITLPRPASLAAFGNGAISMAFHPRLPLLYVWQDTTGPAFTGSRQGQCSDEGVRPPAYLQRLGDRAAAARAGIGSRGQERFATVRP